MDGSNYGREPLMKLFPQRSNVGVDLGSHRIKVAQIESEAGGGKVVRSASVPTPPDSIRDGLVVDAKAVAEALSEALKLGRITATHGIVAAAGSSVFIRAVPFPKQTESVLRKSIKIEAARFIPGSPAESFIEFEILGNLDDGRMSVLVVAASKEVVESRIAVCEAAGLSVEVVDLETFAMYRSLIEAAGSQPGEDGAIAMIDIGCGTTILSVIHQGSFVVNRAVPHGGRLLTDALKSYFKLEEADAEDGKSQLDVRELLDTAPKENPPLRIVQPHVDDLVREVRRSLNYFESQQSETPDQVQRVSRIILAGGGAKLSGLAQYMQEKLGVPVDCEGIYACGQFRSLGDAGDSGLDLAVAAGLAIHGTIRRAA